MVEQENTQTGKKVGANTFDDGHIVTIWENGLSCTCGKTTSYLTDFGPMQRRFIPCEHMAAILERPRQNK